MLRRITVVSFLVVALGGCTMSPVVGTWTGRGAGSDAPFTFGSVSFVGDKTFTAEARYAGTTRVQSGTWETDGDRPSLVSGDSTREYTYDVRDGELVVTDPKSRHSITLDRLGK